MSRPKMKRSKMVRVNFHLTESQIKILEKISNKTSESVASLIRKAVNQTYAV